MSCDYGSTVTPCQPPDFVKDQNSTEDFPFNWAPELDGDTIATSAFSLPDGLTSVSTANTTTTTTIFVSGGTCDSLYRITNRVTTAGGRTWDKTIRILVSAQ